MDKTKQLHQLRCGNISTLNYSGKSQNWQYFDYSNNIEVINIPFLSDKNHVFFRKITLKLRKARNRFHFF